MDFLDPRALLATIEQLPPARTFLTDTFFPGAITHLSRTIDVDIVKGGRRTAPYVSPVQEGVVMKKLGYRTDTIKLPYLKAKYDISAVEAARRLPGENPYAGSTPAQRAQVILGRKLIEGKQAIARTIEMQAMQALTTGKVTAKGKTEADTDWTIEVDFSRDAGLTITKASGDYWTVSTINPLDDLRAWVKSVLKAGGYVPTEIIMGTDALSGFINNANIQKLLDNRRMSISAAIDMKPYDGQGVQYVGTVEGLNIYHYVEWYEDPSTGAVTEMIPPNSIVMACKNTRNTVNYGAIVDLDATGGQPADRMIFPKTWKEDDPSALFLMLQSSPLATLHEPDTTLKARVVA